MKKSFKILEKYKDDLSEEDYEKAKNELKKIIESEEVTERNSKHCYDRIFPITALYKALGSDEKAYETVRDLYYKKDIYPNVKKLKLILKIPGLYRLVPKLALKSMTTEYAPSPGGFQIDIIEAKKDIVRANFTRCPYNEYLKKFKVPELCDIFCTTDDISAQAMHDGNPKIVFERTKTLGRGDELCDFCYRIKNKE